MGVNQKVIGVIFAGGEGRRLGGVSKALIEVNGVPLWKRISSQLSEVSDETVVVSPRQPDWLKYGENLVWVPDTLVGGEPVGPAGALAAALNYACNSFGGGALVVTVPVDAPFYEYVLSDRLLKALALHRSAVVISETASRVQPTFGVWRASLARAVEKDVRAGVRALHRIASKHNAYRLRFDGNDRRFFNINTPEDLARAQRWSG